MALPSGWSGKKNAVKGFGVNLLNYLLCYKVVAESLICKPNDWLPSVIILIRNLFCQDAFMQ